MIKIKLCFVSLKISPLLKNIKISESIGGAELQQLLIGRELSRRAYDISYITTSNEVENIRTVHNFKIIPTFNQEEGIKIIKFFHPRLTKLWKALHEADADIYYVRTASYILAVVALYVRLNNKKLVYCGSNDPEFDPKALRMPVLFRDKLMFFWGLKRADAVVAQNEFQKRLENQQF